MPGSSTFSPGKCRCTASTGQYNAKKGQMHSRAPAPFFFDDLECAPRSLCAVSVERLFFYFAFGATAFAERSAAMKAPVGLLSGSAVCDSRWRGVAPTSATPTRSLGKLARVREVKSRMDRKFSRIENLWPRDGSCPLPLRSKLLSGNCFRIVKTQK